MSVPVPRSPFREIAGVLFGLAVGLIVIGAVQPFGKGAPAADPPAAASTRNGSGTGSGGGIIAPQEMPITGVNIGGGPAALDAQWYAASAKSTCADWAGGDGTSAVRLNSRQVVWFFSDSYLGPAGPAQGFSRSTGLVHNSVVVQTATAAGSKFVTLTGGHTCSKNKKVHPASVVSTVPPGGREPGVRYAPGRSSVRYWAEGGIRVNSMVYEFYNSFSPGNIPYVPQRTVIAGYSVKKLEAAGRAGKKGGIARPVIIALPPFQPKIAGKKAQTSIVWGAAVIQLDGKVYVYGTDMPNTKEINRVLYVAQVPAAKLADFGAWRFYAGGHKWAAGQSHARPVEPKAAAGSLPVSTGFGVVRAGKRYWLIQADPLAGSADIDAYPAANPWGPFDPAAKEVLYVDSGIGIDANHDFRLMYEARAEPAVSPSGSIMISYNVNSTGMSLGCTPMSWFDSTITVPRFISVPLATLSGGLAELAAQQQGTTAKSGAGTLQWYGLTGGSGIAADPGQGIPPVGAGPPDYPVISAGDPDQWVNSWIYPDLCPPVPAETSVTAAPGPSGSVTLSWPDVGLGLAYLIYLKSPGASGFVLKQTEGWVLSVPTSTPIGTTLTGLAPGTYTAKVVPQNLSFKKGPPAVTTFTIP
jgi:hypothetical protein